MVLLDGGAQVADGVLLVDVDLAGDIELLSDGAELACGLGMVVAQGGALGVARDGFKAEYTAASEGV